MKAEKWAEWLQFPDPKNGDFLYAPFGAGCYFAASKA